MPSSRLCHIIIVQVPCSAPSASACKERCAARCRCFAYVYSPEGRCYLKARGAANASWVPNAGFVSGRCDDPNPRCDEVEVNVLAHERTFRNEALKNSFHLRRWATPCSYGDYGRENAPGHAPRQLQGGNSDEPFNPHDFVSKCGVRHPTYQVHQPPLDARVDVDLPGRDLPVQCEGALPYVPCPAPSAAKCKERCAARCRCYAYVYSLEGRCYLKGRAVVNDTLVPRAGYVSGRADAEAGSECSGDGMGRGESSFGNDGGGH